MSSFSRRSRASAPALVLALVVSLAGPAADAQDQGRLGVFGHRYSVIVGASAFVPGDRATRDAYGDVSFTPALSLWVFDGPSGVGLSFDLGGGRISGDGGRADSLHAGVGPRFRFTSGDADVAPYATVRGDAYVMRLGGGSWTTKPGANVEVGAAVLRHLVLSVRYDLVPKIQGVDLSGFGARVAVKVF